MMKKYILAFTLAFLLGSLFVGVAFAQEGTPSDNQVNAIAKQLYCPVCENTPLDVCPTDACRQWRELIRKQLSEGWTEDQIKQYFVTNYGERVLGEPPRRGFNWLVYLVPPVIILAGLITLFRALKQWTLPKTTPTDTGPERSESSSKSDVYVARLEDELKKRNHE